MEQEIFYKGYKIKIRQDEYAESPDDWKDNKIFLVYDHRDFTVEREGFEPEDIYDYLQIKKILLKQDSELFQDREILEDDLKGYFDYESQYWIFPVEAYIHSGIVLSLTELDKPKTCYWDSSITGFVLADNSEFVVEQEAKDAAEGLIETWNQYLSGEVYGFIIEKPVTTYSIEKFLFEKHLLEGTTLRDLQKDFMEDNDWEEIDSCWGYYGDPEKSGLMDEAKATIDYESDKV